MSEKSELIIQPTNLRKYFYLIFNKRKTNEACNEKYNNKNTYYENNPNKNKDKKRNPGVDLVRILGMWCIIIHHILYHSHVIDKYNYKILTFINISSFWHVNSFALISGVVGYKTHKYSNLIYLWFCVVIYQFGIHYLYRLKNKNINPKFIYDFFPVAFMKYWYFTKYFGMYLFVPIINRGIEYISKNRIKLFLFSFYSIYIIWNDYINPVVDLFNLDRGYSINWFAISYITGAYIGKYENNYIGKRKFIFYLILLSIYIFSSFICYKIYYYEINSINNNSKKK